MELRCCLFCASLTLLLTSVFYQEPVSSSPIRGTYLDKNGRHPAQRVGTPWTTCGNPGDLINITAVTVTPMPPKRGQSVTISANITLGENVTNGTFNVQLKYGIFVVFNNETNLCDAVKYSHEECPMGVGDHVIGVGFVVPQKSLKGHYNGTINAVDQNKNELFCISVEFQI